MATESLALSSRAVLRANIDLNSTFDVAFVTMNTLASVVCCYGLFENSPAVVIGAMIIAMLLGPIAGVSLGLVDRNNQLFWKALVTLAGGFAVTYATAFILGVVQPHFPLTNEIYSRTTPNLMDLMIALGGGAAGAYSMISPRLNVAFVGVAIATALVPPLASSAILLARGEYGLAFGALLLTFTNIVGIQVAGSLVMWLNGFRGTPQHHSGGEIKRNLLSAVTLCALAVVLAVQLRNVISRDDYEASVRKILTAETGAHKGAYLAEVRFQQAPGRMMVVADYRTPIPFTPEEVAAVEQKLPLRAGESSVDLRIRSIPVTVASKSGFLFSSEDLSDYVRPQ